MLIIALFLLYLIWGLNWTVMKIASVYFEPELFATSRFLVGFIVLLPFVFFNKNHRNNLKNIIVDSFVPLRNLSESDTSSYFSIFSLIFRLKNCSLFWIALAGILHISYSNVVVQIAISHLGAGVSCVLNYTMPIFVAILSYIVLKEKFSFVKSLGIGLAFIGLFVIMNFRLEGELSMMFFALSGALSWAVANLIIKTKLGGLDKLAHTTLQLGFGTFFLIVYSCIVVKSLPVFNLTSILCLLYNGVLASALCFVLWSFVVDQMDPSALAVSSMLTPLIGVLGGVVFLSERLSSRMIFGMVLLLLGVLLVQIVVRHQKKSSNTVEKKLQ